MSFQWLLAVTRSAQWSPMWTLSAIFTYKRSALTIRPLCKFANPLNSLHHLSHLCLPPVCLSFRRKSITGNWKANIGAAMLEQVPITDKYKKWLDEVCEIFGGLDILTVEAVAAKDGTEYIYEVTGSQMTLMGETQEEDRRLIAELVYQKLSAITLPSRPVIALVSKLHVLLLLPTSC